MSANKFIISFSAVLLAAGLTALPELAFAQKCTKAERKIPPRCLVITAMDGKWALGQSFSGGYGRFSRGITKYKVENNCGRVIKIHEDIRRRGDRGYKLYDGNTAERKITNWFGQAFRAIECCDVRTPGYHFTCDEKG